MDLFPPGLYVALPSFFCSGEDLDLEAFEKHASFLGQSPICGLVIGGTTGESLALTHAERAILTQKARDLFPNKTIIGCVVGFSKIQLQAQSLAFESGGAQALLALSPPYIKSNEEGLWSYFSSLTEYTSLPIILYSNPARTHATLNPQWIARLVQAFPDRFIGLKDSTQDSERPLALYAALQDIQQPFHFFAGDDGLMGALLHYGVTRIISVSGNCIPYLWDQVLKAPSLEGFERLYRFHQILYQQTNPLGIKNACALMGYGDASMRFSLEAPQAYRADLEKALQEAGILAATL